VRPFGRAAGAGATAELGTAGDPAAWPRLLVPSWLPTDAAPAPFASLDAFCCALVLLIVSLKPGLPCELLMVAALFVVTECGRS
jgi:hypothetical protein